MVGKTVRSSLPGLAWGAEGSTRTRTFWVYATWAYPREEERIAANSNLVRMAARLVARAGGGKFCTGCEDERRGFGVVKWFLCRVLRDVIPPTPPGPEGS